MKLVSKAGQAEVATERPPVLLSRYRDWLHAHGSEACRLSARLEQAGQAANESLAA